MQFKYQFKIHSKLYILLSIHTCVEKFRIIILSTYLMHGIEETEN